jgi:ParB family transcriptional regulator, chromosome partitioning protein
MPDHSRKALGKGLSALIPVSRTLPTPAAAAGAHDSTSSTTPSTVSIDDIEPNPIQPRHVFEPDRLWDLANSIRENGIIQPLIVQQRGTRYQLVAGERRWRAAKLAGLAEVPVVVREFADDRLLEVSLIENIQREDLNPIEVAQAFDRLTKEFHLSHDDVGKRTGKDRATITNMLRLLRLPPDIQQLVAEHRLSMGHARAIVSLPTPELQRQVAERSVSQGMSVRQVERLIQRMTEPRETKEPDKVDQIDANTKAALEELERVLGTRVRIVPRGDNRGRIEIEYYSPDDLQRIYQLIVDEQPN